jgi:ketosteroid isomerase-like protein
MDILEHPASAVTAQVLHEFNRAFQEYDPSLLPPLIAPDCVIERLTPTAEGTHLVGREACLASWQAIAAHRAGRFTLGEVWILGDRGLIFWEYRVGDTTQTGLNVMTVRDGLIVEGRGYTKGKA